jgi:muramoyltetrapeptide carboxypeptidase
MRNKNICILSPAGSIDAEVVHRGIATLSKWGHHVSIAPHALGQYGRYAAPPQARAADLRAALEDPKIDILWCSRGGYGCMQILDQIPTELIASSGKWLVGYSDITALHALWQRAGVRSLHAPMMKHLGEAPNHPTTLALRSWLEEPSTLPSVHVTPHPCNRPGVAEGRLVGGNLTVLSGLHGTGFDFDYRGAILFIEDIGESPYKVDRMMQTLRLCDALQQLRGCIVGQFTDYTEDPQMPVSMIENIRDIIASAAPNIPVLCGAPIGHVTENAPLVEGALCRLTVTPDEASYSFSF